MAGRSQALLGDRWRPRALTGWRTRVGQSPTRTTEAWALVRKKLPRLLLCGFRRHKSGGESEVGMTFEFAGRAACGCVRKYVYGGIVGCVVRISDRRTASPVNDAIIFCATYASYGMK